MKSIHTRLVVVLMLTIFSFWAAWTSWQSLQVTWQSAPAWDADLARTAKGILLSLPENISDIEGRGRLRAAPNSGIDDQGFSFQIWVAGSHTKLISSIEAPETALKADFRDGSALVSIAGEPWRVSALTDAQGRIQVQTGVRATEIRHELRVIGQQSLLVAAGMFILLSCIIWIVIRWSLRPVAAVGELIARRHPMDLAPLPDESLPTEVQPLVQSFNRLLLQLDATMQSEKRFIADAAHELRAPLAALMAQAQLASGANDLESIKTILAKVVQGAERSARLSEQLLDSARLDAGRAAAGAQRIAVHELVSLVLHDFELTAGQNNQTILLEAQPAEVRGDMDDIGILVRNLIDNACRYAGAGARIVVLCVMSDRHGVPGVRVTVADNGPGVAVEERGRIFDRFYRIPGTHGRGSGIGLSLVARITRLHGGELEASEGLGGRGLAVSVWLPALMTDDGGHPGALADTQELRAGFDGACTRPNRRN